LLLGIPALTLRLLSEQADGANLWRVLQKTADADGAPPALEAVGRERLSAQVAPTGSG
jgi:hypothetical protein